MSSHTVELKAADRPFTGLSERIMNGEVFLLKNGLNEAGLFDMLENATYSGISNRLGEDVANRVRDAGLEKIHTVVTAGDIPDLTDAVYDIMTARSRDFLKRFIREFMGASSEFYFERKPNVRFHIPHDIAVAQMDGFKEFAKRRGDGKITPHNPHRDSWVDCPDNLINVWIAVGPIKTGNSLTIYPEVYGRDIGKAGPYISGDANPGPAETFDMEAGDVLLFHGDQVHGSEINSTDCTRHVISFRITLEKPHYPYGHYHHYAYSKLAGGMLDIFAEVPQNLAWSYVDYRFRLAGRKLRELVGKNSRKTATMQRVVADNVEGQALAEGFTIPLAKLQSGRIQALSDKICITRLEDGEVRAFSRFCPHQGADLSLGVVRNGEVLCPWHNLPLDPGTGTSPCHSLKKLKTYRCEIREDQVVVSAEA